MKTNNMTLEKQILQKIRERNLRPTPKGYFYARNIVIWVLLGVFVAALSLGFAMTIFMIHGTDFGLFAKLELSDSQKVIYSIPFFWIAASIAVAIVAYINFRNTRRGYKLSVKQFAFIAALIALAFGSILYSFDIAKYVDTAASENLPFYNAVVPLNTNRWLDPEHGLLSGAVRDRESVSDFYLRDADGVLWHVTGANIRIPDAMIWGSGDWIKIIGVKTGIDEFRAIEILPWEERAHNGPKEVAQ